MPHLQRPGARLHYVEAGAGEPALLFVHGALCDHTDWLAQLQHFAAHRRVVALDLRGHGASSGEAGSIGVLHFADDVQALCERLGLARVVLVGHSMGCRVVLQACRDAPRRVAGAVLVDGAYLAPGPLGPMTPQERAQRVEQARARAAALYAAEAPSLRVRRGFAQMFFDGRFAAERDRVVERAAALPDRIARELMPDFAAWDLQWMEETLAGLRVPVLAIACTRMDSEHQRRMLQAGESTAWLEALAACVPQARILRYQGSGHFPMLEDPGRINADIAGFLAAIARAEPAPDP